MITGHTKKILVTIQYYLPGYRAGGPVRSLANLVEMLGDEFEFYILTADRDLGVRQPFAKIKTGFWHRVGKASVCYLGPARQSWVACRARLHELDYDVLYV